MPDVSPSDLERAAALLDTIQDPKSGRGLVSAGLVQGLWVEGDRAGFVLEAPKADAPLYAPVREAAQSALATLPGVSRAQVVLTTATETPSPYSVSGRRSARVPPDPRAQPGAMPPAASLEHVRRVVAVASGKGGVGKSTVAVNLACALTGLGLKVGLLDADIYGPSAPRMLGIVEKPEFVDGKLVPLQAFGLKVMSIGFIVEEGRAMIWRGPMASSAVRQMIEDVRWGGEGDPLDVLVVDLPPGTGDIHLTLIQRLKLDGAVLVSTPQEIALIDARRAAAMFRTVNPPVPILGVVENMAWFQDASGARVPIFGEGGARAEAESMGAPFLGEVPLDVELRRSGDEGRPIAAAPISSIAGETFRAMAKRLAEVLNLA